MGVKIFFSRTTVSEKKLMFMQRRLNKLSPSRKEWINIIKEGCKVQNWKISGKILKIVLKNYSVTVCDILRKISIHGVDSKLSTSVTNSDRKWVPKRKGKLNIDTYMYREKYLKIFFSTITTLHFVIIILLFKHAHIIMYSWFFLIVSHTPSWAQCFR